MAEEILTVLDHMITNLEQEERYWCMKIERLFNQGGHNDNMLSLIFVQYHFSGLPGRPKFHLDVDQIESLSAMGFSFTNISKMFGISRSTLYRHCADLGVDHRRITDISGQKLDVTIMKLKEVLPHVGERVIIGHLRQSGIYVQGERGSGSPYTVLTLQTLLYDGISLDGHMWHSRRKSTFRRKNTKMSYLYHVVALTLLYLLVFVALQSVLLFPSYKGKRVDH